MRIVIIEDEEELGILMRNYIRRRILAERTDSITIAKNLKDGLSFVKEMEPEWVILDNNLPDGKGINALAIIKGMARQTRILMMSAMTNIKEEALRNGADFFLDKPISFTEISRIITR